LGANCQLSDYRPFASANSSDEFFHEWVRQPNKGYALYLRDVEDPQVGFPSMKPAQQIIIRTQISWACRCARDAVEQSAGHRCIDKTRMDGEANDLSG
jgi:hypothetical protein